VNGFLVATRAIHFASTLIVFGGIAVALFVARPARQGAERRALAMQSVERVTRVMLLWVLAISVLSALLWLALEAPLMSGEKLEDALTGPIFGIVVSQTWFGRVLIVRLALAILLIRWLAVGARKVPVGALAIAAAYLALPALAGHAAGGQGSERYFRIVADMVHLLAAGAWVGALPGLAIVLIAARREAAIESAARAARRFSTLGTISVATLVVTGTINSFYLVRSLDALMDTEYGRLLLAKLALVAAMLGLAAVNRWSLSPRLGGGDAAALGALTRNTVLEVIAGIAVVAIVGVLGITVPAMHPAHHELHSGTSRVMISSSTGFERDIQASPWPNPTSSTSRFPKASTMISKRSSDPIPFRRTAWIWRCSMVSSLRSSAGRS
jgi:copper resistance protein D